MRYVTGGVSHTLLSITEAYYMIYAHGSDYSVVWQIRQISQWGGLEADGLSATEII
jgi:hypothetical protein